MLRRTATKLHSLLEKQREATGQRSHLRTTPMVLGIIGGSCSGKSAFCTWLAEILGSPNVLWINETDYLYNGNELAHADNPKNVEYDLLQSHLDDLSAGCSVGVPEYDLRSFRRIAVRQIAMPRPVILVEGGFLCSSPALMNRIHIKVFIDAEQETRVQRRLQRETKIMGRTKEAAEKLIEDVVLPAHAAYIEPQKLGSDHIIASGNFESGLRELAPMLMDFVLNGLYPLT